MSGTCPAASITEFDFGCLVPHYGIADRIKKPLKINTLQMKSNVKAAEKILEKAKSLANNGQYDKALSLLNERSNELKSYSIFHNMKGVCLQGLQEHDDAVKCFLEGIKINPLDPLPFTGIGNSLFKNLQYAESEKYYELALVVDENYHDALVGIGAVAFQRTQYDKCEEFLKRALQQKPETVTTNTNLGNCYSAQGRHDEALRHLKIAAKNARKNSPTFMNLGLIGLGRGEFETAWDFYEHRFNEDNFIAERFTRIPRWAKPLGEPKKVLIWAEQGLGDEIMYASLYHELVGLSETFVVECDPRLLPIYQQSFPRLLLTAKTNANDATGLDYQIPLASLPSVFRRSKTAFESAVHPFLTLPPPNSEQQKLLAQLRTLPRPRIGVSWESFALTANFRERKSIPAAEFAALTRSSSGTFINLQFPNPNHHETPRVQDIPPNVMTLPNVDLKNDITTLGMIIKELDQVITIGNTVAHLCGALAKPATVLLPSVADWRWGFSGERSIWYPSLTLKRNTQASSWTTLLNTIQI